MHSRAIGTQRRMSVDNRWQHFVFDFDRFHCGTRQRFTFGHHAGQHIADVMGLFAHANHERPILFDQANYPVTRHIGGGEDADDTGHGRRSASVDAENFGPWMVTKF